MKKTILILIIVLAVLFAVEALLRLSGYIYLSRHYLSMIDRNLNENEVVNIICLGESSTAGLWVDWQDSYPRQLEKKLREYYHNQLIRVIMPPHVGQNTSQVANRIRSYLKLYKPKLVILMAGYNNEWSLAESHIGKFIDNNDPVKLKARFFVAINNLRIFKVLRYFYLKVIAKETTGLYMEQNRDYIWGHPELVRVPAKKWVYDFAYANREAFVKLWRYDIQNIIHEAKKSGSEVLLMTYHINPTYLSVEEFKLMADEQKIKLVRNDLSFNELMRNKTVKNYLLHDNWHPNREGYVIIAQNAFDAIINNSLLPVRRSKKYPYQASLAIVKKDITGIGGNRARFEVEVTNTGEQKWENSDQIKIGCRIYDICNKAVLPVKELRFELKSGIASEEKFSTEFVINDNDIPPSGEYMLKFDVVKEHKFWFEDLGSTPLIEYLAYK